MTTPRCASRFFCSGVLVIWGMAFAGAGEPLHTLAPEKPGFASWILGSQWVGGLSEGQPLAASFVGKQPLHEAWRIMGGIGSDIIKISIAKKELEKQGHDATACESLTDVVRHPHFKHVFDLPYRVMLLWAHGGSEGWHRKPMSEHQKASLRKEFFDLTRHLLTEYRGTGKTFLIGNWEGDWLAGGQSVGKDADLDPQRIEAFQEWLDIRTKAIDDAKQDCPSDGVAVYSYLEVNHVSRARVKGCKRLVNTVLPRSRVDYVSLSSYEMFGYSLWSKPRDEATIRPLIVETLDYVEKHLPPRTIAGKRVFIGEIGFTVDEIQRKQKLTAHHADREQARLALIQAKVSLEWGVPLWLWWSIFDSNDGTDSFGLVHQATGKRSTLFKEFQTYYEWATAYCRQYRDRHGDDPDQTMFRESAVTQLDRQIRRLAE
jgi:hypothetical protein